MAVDMWQPGLAIVDFTNLQPASGTAKLRGTARYGVDCFKTDLVRESGQMRYITTVLIRSRCTTTIHTLYNKVVFNVLKKKKGEKEAVLFARSATAGGQKFPVHWGGDCWSDYESMEESLRGGLSLTSSGFDTGAMISEDLRVPPHRMSIRDGVHSDCFLPIQDCTDLLSYRVPWAYDEEAVDVVRYFAQLKASLMPYLYRNAIETSKTGIPMMRSMVLEFTEDKNWRLPGKPVYVR